MAPARSPAARPCAGIANTSLAESVIVTVPFAVAGHAGAVPPQRSATVPPVVPDEPRYKLADCATPTSLLNFSVTFNAVRSEEAATVTCPDPVVNTAGTSL